MKKILYLLLIMVFTISLSACNGKLQSAKFVGTVDNDKIVKYYEARRDKITYYEFKTTIDFEKNKIRTQNAKDAVAKRSKMMVEQWNKAEGVKATCSVDDFGVTVKLIIHFDGADVEKLKKVGIFEKTSEKTHWSFKKTKQNDIDDGLKEVQ